MPASRLRAALILATVAAGTSSAAAFVIDLESAALRAATDQLSIFDLAVGEVGIVAYPTFCHLNGLLYATGVLPLAESVGMQSAIFRFKRMPEFVFDLAIEVPQESAKPVDFWIANMALYAAATPCTMDGARDGLAKIGTINGEEFISRLLP